LIDCNNEENKLNKELKIVEDNIFISKKEERIASE
jgi:flagellar biosynthesis regulator FlaF